MKTSTRTRWVLTILGFFGGVFAVSLLLAVLFAGTSFMGLDLLIGGLAGTAVARQLTTGRVPVGLSVALVVLSAAFVVLGALAVLILSSWS